MSKGHDRVERFVLDYLPERRSLVSLPLDRERPLALPAAHPEPNRVWLAGVLALDDH